MGMFVLAWMIAGFVVGWMLVEFIAMSTNATSPLMFNFALGFVGALTAFTILCH